MIYIAGISPFEGYCDMKTEGGGKGTYFARCGCLTLLIRTIN